MQDEFKSQYYASWNRDKHVAKLISILYCRG